MPESGEEKRWLGMEWNLTNRFYKSRVEVGKPGLTVSEAAKVLGVHVNTIKQSIYTGKLRASEVGLCGRIEVDKKAVEEIRKGRIR